MSSTAMSVVGSAGEQVALTTTFTPPPQCNQGHFTMLAEKSYQIWLNEPLPVQSTTVTSCYPQEFVSSYILASSWPQYAVSYPFTPLICPEDYSTATSVSGGYIACCPSSFQYAPPVGAPANRPAWGGTCYTEINSVTVTAYDSSSVVATSVFSAGATPTFAFAHLIDGFQAGQTITPGIVAASSTPIPTAVLPALTASAPMSAQPTGKTLGEQRITPGGLAGRIVGVVAAVAIIALLLFFLLRYRRRNRTNQQALHNRSESDTAMLRAKSPESVVSEHSSRHSHNVVMHPSLALLNRPTAKPQELDNEAQLHEKGTDAIQHRPHHGPMSPATPRSEVHIPELPPIEASRPVAELMGSPSRLSHPSGSGQDWWKRSDWDDKARRARLRDSISRHNHPAKRDTVGQGATSRHVDAKRSAVSPKPVKEEKEASRESRIQPGIAPPPNNEDGRAQPDRTGGGEVSGKGWKDICAELRQKYDFKVDPELPMGQSRDWRRLAKELREKYTQDLSSP